VTALSTRPWVSAVTPPAHAALLTHMRREEAKNEKRRKASVAGSELGKTAKVGTN